jgi:hypothetical protein
MGRKKWRRPESESQRERERRRRRKLGEEEEDWRVVWERGARQGKGGCSVGEGSGGDVP